MIAHKYLGLAAFAKTSDPAKCCTAYCSCGASFDAKTVTARRATHRQHVAEVKAKARRADLLLRLANALTRWAGAPAQLLLDLENLCDWAQRDQEECHQVEDDDDRRRDVLNNMKIIGEFRRALPLIFKLDGWGRP